MSLERFVGKVAVVTGASAGIGRELVKALVKEGVTVAGLARRSERIEEIAQELKNEKGKLHAFKCDLTKDEEILATFKKITETLGPISILVNNAGLSPATELIDGDISKWRQIIDTNILALSICTREAIASMKANNIKGHIVHINSIAGHMPLDLVGFSVYPATKYAVTALTESLRREINRNGLPIKVTSVSPGYVETDFFVSMYDSKDLPAYLERSGLKAKDVADTVVYVLSTPEHVNIKELTVMVQGQLT